MATNFQDDLEYSQKAIEYLQGVYKIKSFEGRYVHILKGKKYSSLGSENLQKNFGIDTIVQVSQNESILIEEKIRTGDYGDILIETMSCSVPGFEKKGWIYTSQADFICYVIDSEKIKLYIMKMSTLKNFHRLNEHKYKKIKTDQINKTEFYCVPWSHFNMEDYEKYESN